MNDAKEIISHIDDKATILLKALPYVQGFREKTFVIKIGGEVIDGDALPTILKDIALLHSIGIQIIVVHGGGGQLNKYMKERGQPVRIINGRRITDDETIKVAEMIYRGRINTEVVSQLRKEGAKAVGLSGVDGNLITTARRDPQNIKNNETGKIEMVDFGNVGDIQSVDITILNQILEIGFIPVICSLAADKKGNVHNVNADVVAMELAVATKAVKMIIMTCTPGVLENPEDPKTVIPIITSKKAHQMIKKKQITGGMIPKVECALNAVTLGISRVHIINGLTDHSLLLEVLTAKGTGTMITSDAEEKRYLDEIANNQVTM